ncbi:hypothetical protein LOK49_LG08G01817 [Camellia lanceoleosa]|uniref:Uncharacterized protein n=1 Tax=Camellia lanceoleosa TaxID=1840588 RepID=A0ACC0GPU9_9ERIC|nr:hypothetical protein LOK49_LG08G01817 [Camellia lanceoleosa]
MEAPAGGIDDMRLLCVFPPHLTTPSKMQNLLESEGDLSRPAAVMVHGLIIQVYINSWADLFYWWKASLSNGFIGPSTQGPIV